ncbi:MAG: hypothetical protein ACLUD2_05460 [Clostridium sp.]
MDWRENASGNRSLKIQREDFNRAGKIRAPGGSPDAGTARTGFQIKWLEYGNDIEKITYCLEAGWAVL